MRFSTIFGASVVSLAALPAVFASHGVNMARHNQLAHKLDTREFTINATNATSLEKRAQFDNARWTFYAVGLGACGQTNVPSDFIVALNSAQYGGGYPGPHCFQTITMTANGKTTQATIMDECPGCPYGGLDLSEGLFGFFADLGQGVINGAWSFGGGDPAPAPAPAPSPKPSPKPAPPPPPPAPSPQPSPTSTKEKPSPSPSSSSTPSPSPTSTSSSSTKTSTVTSTSSVNLSSGAASGVAQTDNVNVVPTQAATENMYVLPQAIINVGAFIAGAAGAN